ncbi:hypothetical protein RJD24_15070 [Bacillaceae bacterium IKA-2]|nr:hypothetical protein RJD24_15070 [Bacillaceae bacterium IKA-2]
MLQVTFSYEGEQPIFEIVRNLQFSYDQGVYVLRDVDFVATLSHDSLNKTLVLLFSKELFFEQYKHLHLIVVSLLKDIDGFIDDQLAFMGYLENGQKAYIFNGWSEWELFLEVAKHVSMEGQKVQVYDNQILLAEGILVATVIDTTTKRDFQILQCSIITKTGEMVLTGKQLKIIPTGEF